MHLFDLARKGGLRRFAAAVVFCFVLGLASAGGASSLAAGRDEVQHWAFEPVRRVEPPADEAGNPIDAFLGAALRERGLQRSPAASRGALIRRLYLVMLGVPPQPEEVREFVTGADPLAFEKLVERVLNDPRYGERWARHWLDVVRFAESNGFETNRERPNAWRFRDYVIAAFNGDKPYDAFIREQIAGDSLGADVATGFLVGGPVDIVGSPDPVLTAQQRADELDDMVSTTGTAFLGLTLGCARCHSHKFDPIQHQEYYAMSAFFTGVKHGERALKLPVENKERVAALNARIGELERKLASFRIDQTKRNSALRPAVNAKYNEETFPPFAARRVRFAVKSSSSGEPCLDELEVYAGEKNVALATAATVARASGTLAGFDIHKLEHVNDGLHGNSHSWISSEPGRGWVELEFARVETIERIVWSRDRLGQFGDRVPVEYSIEAAGPSGEWKRLASSDDRAPFEGAKKQAGPRYAFDKCSPEEAEQGRAWVAELEGVLKERTDAAQPPLAYAGAFVAAQPAHRLHRGDPMQKREETPPGTLKLFKPLNLPSDSPEQERRLKLAEWIASPENPLTARVMVNRIWQHHFGAGLVETPNDFGRNGAKPSHPELLDWLASEFVRSGWSIKAMQRLILTSAAWQQASAPCAEPLAVDAGNRLLWRFAPRRLEAEAIRDSILAVSGNLDGRAGGPSFHLLKVDRENVYHYFPKEEFGPEESRRMVYAYKIRMEQDGIFGAFDCPDGSLVMPKRSVSTTPLQALNLFNSRFVLRQAQILSERLRREGGESIERQIDRGWELAFNRAPSQSEIEEAAQFAREQGMPALCRALLNANEFLFVP